MASYVQQIAYIVVDRSGPSSGACRVSRGRVRKVCSQALSLNVCFEAKRIARIVLAPNSTRGGVT
jgi:hypothetical protein